TFASCVAETVMTGLGGGGYAVHWDAARREAHLIDFFVNVPGRGAEVGSGERHSVDVAFGDHIIPYDIGMGTVAVPGVAQGCGELHDRWGRLEWTALLEPARGLAVEGVEMPSRHAFTMLMVLPALASDVGARIYTPDGAPLQTGDVLRQPGLATAFDLLASEGPQTFVKGTIAERLLALSAERGGLLTARDLEDYEVRVTPAERGVAFGPYRVTARRDLVGFLDALERLPHALAGDARRWAPAFADAFTGRDRNGDTTNLVTADHQGNACVVTSSLGLGSGHYIPDLDLHLNSMLGETELLTARSHPGSRMHSMMVPSLAIDDRGDVVAAAGAAGGSRIRTALAHVFTATLLQGVEPDAAARSPRLHPVGRVANVEPGYPEAGLAGLGDAGYEIRQWSEIHHFFGGASLLTALGGGADPRRDGAAQLL
ncbi:MAG TPA: gamma-glutamyltransferase, partial [Euzebyales bacterium]|nr:gamma-glutamyltransferase [Euzebyales bacterium]